MSRPRPLTEEALSRQYLREHPTPSSRLAEHAETIRKIGKRVTRDIIKIGRILTEAKALTGHGGWLPWLKERVRMVGNVRA